LNDAAAERFSQGDLFSAIDPNATAIEILEDGLSDALGGNLSSERFDATLLRTFAGFGRVFRHGIDAVELDDGERTRLDRAAMGRLEALQRQIPPDQRVSIVGTIEMLQHSRRMFSIRVDEGKEIRGVVVNDALSSDDLGRLFGRRTRVSGLATFRASGETLLVEAQALEPADDEGGVLSRAPRALFSTLDTRNLHRPQGPRSGVAAVMGLWPGEESDEEVEALLKELS
jgi:hypothetical protein